MSRRPQPLEIKLAKGTQNRTRERLRNEIMPESVDPNYLPLPPSELGPEAAELWTRVCCQQAGVGILFPSTFEYLLGYCRAFEIKEQAWQEVLRDGMYVYEGQTEKHPGVRRVSQPYKVYNEQIEKMILLGSKLGLSPVDKTRISQSITTSNKDKNSIKRIGVTG